MIKFNKILGIKRQIRCNYMSNMRLISMRKNLVLRIITHIRERLKWTKSNLFTDYHKNMIMTLQVQLFMFMIYHFSSLLKALHKSIIKMKMAVKPNLIKSVRKHRRFLRMDCTKRRSILTQIQRVRFTWCQV